MLDGGEDPRYICRRLLRFAYEDVGLAEPQAEGDVFEHGEMRPQGVPLEHHAGVPLFRGERRDFEIAEPDEARRGGLEARDHAKQGGLAAAGRAQQEEQPTGGHGQVDARHGGRGSETLDDLLGSVEDGKLRRRLAGRRRGRNECHSGRTYRGSES